MSEVKLSNLIVHQICGLNKIHLTSSERKYRKNRELWALAFKTAGQTIYEAGGQTYKSDSNHVILLPKGSSYFVTYLTLGECLMIEFEASYSGESPLPQQVEVNNMTEMIHIFARMERFWTFKKSVYKLKCMAGLYELLAKLEESRAGNSYQLSSKFDLIKPAVCYLEENYNDPGLDTEMLARIAGISMVYFRKIFTEIYRIPPMKYIGIVRIQKAKDMLISDYSSITAIAEAVGINGIYQFSKIFKNATGYTPSEYARSYSHTYKKRSN